MPKVRPLNPQSLSPALLTQHTPSHRRASASLPECSDRFADTRHLQAYACNPAQCTATDGGYATADDESLTLATSRLTPAIKRNAPPHHDTHSGDSQRWQHHRHTRVHRTLLTQRHRHTCAHRALLTQRTHAPKRVPLHA
ncbi:MAG: hypothetical protein ACI4BC_05655, partial [Muribaculaceae bacterium]